MSMEYNRNSFIGGILHTFIAHYNHKLFWRMREIVVDNPKSCNILLRVFYLVRIKRMEAFNCASFGTALGAGARFKTPPILPHGITGTFISHSAQIGANCVILQNVTIGSSKKKAPAIGDNCIIGACAVIVGGVTIGNNVRIGANCVVTHDVPDNCTVVMPAPRIIYRNDEASPREWVF